MGWKKAVQLHTCMMEIYKELDSDPCRSLPTHDTLWFYNNALTGLSYSHSPFTFSVISCSHTCFILEAKVIYYLCGQSGRILWLYDPRCGTLQSKVLEAGCSLGGMFWESHFRTGTGQRTAQDPVNFAAKALCSYLVLSHGCLCCQTGGRGAGVKEDEMGHCLPWVGFDEMVQTEVPVRWKGQCLSLTEPDLSGVSAHCDLAQFSDKAEN